MTKYLKIETPFERATDGSKKLIEGKFRNETVEYLANSEWVFTEKNRRYKHRDCLGWT